MTKIARAAALSCSLLLMSACVTDGMGPKQVGGSLIGAAAGGLAGSQMGGGSGKLALTAGGVLLGALLGGAVGEAFDKVDQDRANAAREQALNGRIGRSSRWRNRESGNRGEIVVVDQGRDEASRFCREYQETITVGGRTERGYGKACQRPDGSWQIVGGT